MRIILLTSSSSRSGGSRQALYLAEGLRDRGHDVVFFTPAHATLRTLAPEATFWRDLPENGSWKTTIEAELPTDGSGAVIHAFHNAAVKNLAWLGLLWRKRPIVTVAHRGVIYKPGNPLPYWLPGIDCFAVNSKACAMVLRKTGVPVKRLKIIYNSVPDGRTVPTTPADTIRKQLGLTDTPVPFLFGSVAGNNTIKGVSFLLQGFAKADIPNAKLVIIGITPETWQSQCNDLGIADKVALVQHTNSVADYMQIMDAFVLPSLAESMPNVLLEAIRMGVPSVCSAVGGVPEVIAGSGILVPPANAGALADALRHMHDDSEARVAMQRAAKAKSDDFAPAKRLNRIEFLYRRLCKRRGVTYTEGTV